MPPLVDALVGRMGSMLAPMTEAEDPRHLRELEARSRECVADPLAPRTGDPEARPRRLRACCSRTPEAGTDVLG
jgi:hypothetical protein